MTERTNRANGRILLNRKDAAHAMSISVRLLDYMIARNALKTVRAGRRVLIPITAIEKLAGPAEQADANPLTGRVR